MGRVATEGFQELLRTNVRGYNTLRYLSHLGTVTCDLSVSCHWAQGNRNSMISRDTVRWDQGKLQETSEPTYSSWYAMGHWKPKGKSLGPPVTGIK